MHRVAAEKTVLNIASGRATSFSELARMIAIQVRGTDAGLRIKVAEDKPKGVYYRVGDTTRAKSFGCKGGTPLPTLLKGMLLKGMLLKGMLLKGMLPLKTLLHEDLK
jgi:hypothetical protein